MLVQSRRGAVASRIVLSNRAIASKEYAQLEWRYRTMNAATSWCWLTLAAGVSSTAIVYPRPAAADSVPFSPFFFCPPGMTRYSGHSGTHCSPNLPDDCPDGFEPRVSGETAYCEPPAAVACPPGSYETSRGPDRPACGVLAACENDGDCDAGYRCQPSRLCIVGPMTDGNPEVDSMAYGECDSAGACTTGGCSDAMRCDPVRRRIDPQGRRHAAIVKGLPVPYSVLYSGCCAIGVLSLVGGAVGFRLSRRNKNSANASA